MLRYNLKKQFFLKEYTKENPKRKRDFLFLFIFFGHTHYVHISDFQKFWFWQTQGLRIRMRKGNANLYFNLFSSHFSCSQPTSYEWHFSRTEQLHYTILSLAGWNTKWKSFGSRSLLRQSRVWWDGTSSRWVNHRSLMAAHRRRDKFVHPVLCCALQADLGKRYGCGKVMAMHSQSQGFNKA